MPGLTRHPATPRLRRKKSLLRSKTWSRWTRIQSGVTGRHGHKMPS